jgi:glycosyltransferase involved in cell wall biosynthesis
VPVRVIAERRAFDTAAASAVSRTIAELRPDVIQTHHIKSHALVAASRARGRTPWVAFHHGYTTTDLKVRLYNLIDRWSLPRADAVVTTCGPFADALARAGVDRQRISVIHNAAPEVPGSVDRTSARRTLGFENIATVVAAGRLSYEKGHDVLIDACAALERLTSDRPALVIAGDGPERSRLAARARERGVRLRLDGFQANLLPYYAAADVVALPSRSEGSPNVLLEAMAAGRPIVATSVGGVPEIAGADGAHLVAPDRPQDLARALALVLNSPALADRLGGAARRQASRFTTTARTAALLDLYARL